MSDIFKYKASLTIQHSRSNEIAPKLPHVFQQRLHRIVARDIRVTSSVITFHGGKSRTATGRYQLFTNWNLLSFISRGAIQIENDYTNFVVSFWIGFPKWAFYIPLFLVAVAIIILIVFQILSPQDGDTIFLLMLSIFGAFSTLGTYPLLTILRFHWFVRSCINQTIREVEKHLSPS